jgi:hypothetical protein
MARRLSREAMTRREGEDKEGEFRVWDITFKIIKDLHQYTVFMSSSKNSLANKAQAWSARFAEPVDELVQRYTASIGFDQRFAMVDIAGSLAHAEMLAKQKSSAPKI